MTIGNTRYSNKIISKLVKGVDGEERLYKARKVAALTTAKEGFKLLKAFAPMMGTGVDSIISQNKIDEEFLEVENNTFGNMLTMLSAHLTDEHFEDLSLKVLGSLMLGDKEIDDLDKHFDEYQGDFIEVLWWLLVENFKSFFMGNAMIRSLIDKVMEMASPKLKEMLSEIKKGLDVDPN